MSDRNPLASVAVVSRRLLGSTRMPTAWLSAPRVWIELLESRRFLSATDPTAVCNAAPDVTVITVPVNGDGSTSDSTDADPTDANDPGADSGDDTQGNWEDDAGDDTADCTDTGDDGTDSGTDDGSTDGSADGSADDSSEDGGTDAEGPLFVGNLPVEKAQTHIQVSVGETKYTLAIDQAGTVTATDADGKPVDDVFTSPFGSVIFNDERVPSHVVALPDGGYGLADGYVPDSVFIDFDKQFNTFEPLGSAYETMVSDVQATGLVSSFATAPSVEFTGTSIAKPHDAQSDFMSIKLFASTPAIARPGDLSASSFFKLTDDQLAGKLTDDSLLTHTKKQPGDVGTDVLS